MKRRAPLPARGGARDPEQARGGARDLEHARARDLENARGARGLALNDRMPVRPGRQVAPPTSARGLGLWVLVLGFGVIGGLGVWAGVAPMTSAVIASGAFEVDGDVQIVQHFDGGIVREIHVREGDTVAAGQVIAILDDSRARAELAILNNQLAGGLARSARLRAEYLDADEVRFPAELRDLVAQYPSLGDVLDSQVEIFRSNKGTDGGSVAILSERIGQLNRLLDGLEERRRTLDQQMTLVSDELEGLGQLYEKGLVVKSRYVARRDDELQIVAALAQTEADRQTALQQIAEIRERLLQVRRERQKTIADEQETVNEQLFDIRQRIDATLAAIDRLTIRAPVAGRIAGFDVNTIGAVLEAGQPILQIVPSGRGSVVAAQVSPSDIDEIAVGGPARVRLSAYSYRRTPPVNGTVSHISANAFFSQQMGASYYEVFVTIPQENLDGIPDVQALPGMPVQVMIETGRETLLTHLLDPVIGGLETALVESE